MEIKDETLTRFLWHPFKTYYCNVGVVSLITDTYPGRRSSTLFYVRFLFLFLGMEIDFPLIRISISLLWLLIARSRDCMVASSSIGGNVTVNTNLTLNGSPYVVSEDITVAKNATLTIQPGVELQFDPGVILHVKGSLQAKGNSREGIVFRKRYRSLGSADNVTWFYNNGTRLSGGPNCRTGRLEIFLNGRWGTVCNDGWDMRDTQVGGTF